MLAVMAACVCFALVGCGDDDKNTLISPLAPGATSASGATGSTGGNESAPGPSGGGSSASKGGTSNTGDPDSGSSDGPDKDGFTAEPPPIQLFVSGTSDVRVSKPTVKLARNQILLDALIKSQSSKSSDRPSATVNFKEGRQAIALFMPKSPRGSQVTISSVSSNGKQTKVNAVMLVPGKGCKASGPRDPRPTAWVETRRLPGIDVIVSVEKTPLSGC